MSTLGFSTEDLKKYQDKIAQDICTQQSLFQSKIQIIIDAYKDSYPEVGSMLKPTSEAAKSLKDRLNSMVEAFEGLIQDVASVETNGEERFDTSEQVESNTYGFADEIFTPDSDVHYWNEAYFEYPAYQFMMSGYSFSNYNVQDNIFSFMNSVGAGFLQFANITDWTSYLTLKYDENSTSHFSSEYAANRYCEAALRELLDDLPKNELMNYQQVFIDSLYSSDAKAFFKFMKSFNGDIKLVLDYCLYSMGELTEYVKKHPDDEEARVALLAMAMNEEEFVLIKEFFSQFADVAGKLGNVVKWTGVAQRALEHFYQDYSNQIGYLDTIENALNAMGYSAYEVRTAVEKVRKQYNNIVYDVLTKSDAFHDIVNGAAGAVLKATPLSAASSVLSAASGIVSMANSDAISAADTLYGLVQYDQALTNRFNELQSLMKERKITDSQMLEAQHLFELLQRTKVKEYESLIELGEAGYDIGDISVRELKHELEELNSFNLDSVTYSTFTTPATGEPGGGGGRF